MSKGLMNGIAPHDLHFTTGETVGHPESRLPDEGRTREYIPPCVALDWWRPHAAGADARFTTVSHWYADEWMEEGDIVYANDKRSGFLPFLDLPRRTPRFRRHSRQVKQLESSATSDCVGQALGQHPCITIGRLSTEADPP